MEDRVAVTRKENSTAGRRVQGQREQADRGKEEGGEAVGEEQSMMGGETGRMGNNREDEWVKRGRRRRRRKERRERREKMKTGEEEERESDKWECRIMDHGWRWGRVITVRRRFCSVLYLHCTCTLLYTECRIESIFVYVYIALHTLHIIEIDECYSAQPLCSTTGMKPKW